MYPFKQFRGNRSLNQICCYHYEPDTLASELVLAAAQSLLAGILTRGNWLIGRHLLHLPIEMRPMTGDKDNHAALVHEWKGRINKLKLRISIDVHGVLRISCDQLALQPSRGIEYDSIQVICPLFDISEKGRNLSEAGHVTGESKTTHVALHYGCGHFLGACRFIAIGERNIISAGCERERCLSSNPARSTGDESDTSAPVLHYSLSCSLPAREVTGQRIR